MPRYISFLRAVNVGGHVVKMNELKSFFQKLEFSKVETFIASGNVIFESKSADASSLERLIEERLHKLLGYKVTVFIRTDAEVVVIARQKPFAESDLNSAPTLVVGFLKKPFSEASRKFFLGLTSDTDLFSTRGREIFWLCRKRQRESKFSNAVFEKKFSLQTTFRGFTTIVKLAQRFPVSMHRS
jgi:uncharacterized protein (DUF1697 family)